MADGNVVIGVELDDGEAKKDAAAAGRKIGEALEGAVTGETSKIGDKISDQLKGVGGKAASSLKGLGVAAVGALGLNAIADAAFAAVDAANEFGEDMGKLETAFSQAGFSAEAANSAYTDFVGILGETDQSVEAVNHLAKLAKSEEQLSEWTGIAAGVFATFGDSLTLESLTESANESAKVGTVVSSLADTLVWAGVAEDEFNEKLAALATEEERAALITDTLSGIYGEAGDAYLENNSAIVEYRKSQSQLTASTAKIGEALMPLISTLMTVASTVLDTAMPAIEWLVSFIMNDVPAAVESLSDLPARVVEIGESIVHGIWDGISSAASWLWDQITGFADGIVEAAMDALGIHSPSKVMAELVGKPMAQGVAVGFDKAGAAKDIQASLLADVTALGMSSRMAYAGSTSNTFIIERIDAHDLAGVNNVESLIALFERNR